MGGKGSSLTKDSLLHYIKKLIKKNSQPLKQLVALKGILSVNKRILIIRLGGSIFLDNKG